MKNLIDKIIILTPIKNEDWILEQFLAISSQFADHIIILDQNSTDKSKEICSKFSKVIVLENLAENYDEAFRQNFLINSARDIFPNNKRILLCLDADELISSDSIHYHDTWLKIRSLELGSSIYFQKPDILTGLKSYAQYENSFFPIGYIDDGIKHTAVKIHSKRIPNNIAGESFYFSDIKILHFALVREKIQGSKQRYYSVIENINKTKPLYLRRFAYKCFYDVKNHYSKAYIHNIPLNWLDEWSQLNINVHDFPEPDVSWQDLEVLKYFKKYGYGKFIYENIWDYDWELARQTAIVNGFEVPEEQIKQPNKLTQIAVLFLDKIYFFYKIFLKKLKHQ